MDIAPIYQVHFFVRAMKAMSALEVEPTVLSVSTRMSASSKKKFVAIEADWMLSASILWVPFIATATLDTLETRN